MARFDKSMFGFVFDPVSKAFEKDIEHEGEALLQAHMTDYEMESLKRRVTAAGTTSQGDYPKTAAGQKLKERDEARYAAAKRGGAAPGLVGQKMRKLAPPPKKKEPSGADRAAALGTEKAKAKEAAIRDYMETLGIPREDAIALYEKNQPRSDRPTG
jgi:hypothetical protein